MMYINGVREKEKSNKQPNRKGPNMKACKIYGVQYKSRSAGALALAKRTNLAEKEIAKRCKISQASVAAAISAEFGRILFGERVLVRQK
jgi:hypothetical protein